MIADTFYVPAGEPNLPYSYERNKLDISGDYDLFSVLPRLGRLRAAREVDRTLQEVASQTEGHGLGKATLAGPSIRCRSIARGGTAKRDIGAYDEALALLLGQNPLMRKYNLAHRYREFGELRFSWTPLAAPVAISLQALHADDDYTRSELGLRRGRQLNIGADFSWAFNENSTVYVHAGSDSDPSRNSSGSETFGPADWTADNEDEFSNHWRGRERQRHWRQVRRRVRVPDHRRRNAYPTRLRSKPAGTVPGNSRTATTNCASSSLTGVPNRWKSTSH